MVYHIRNESKIIELDLIQVYNERGCGNISKVQYEVCSRDFTEECVRPWEEQGSHNLTTDIYQDIDDVWKIEIYWGNKHTQNSSIQFEIRSSLAFSRGSSPTKYFHSEIHIDSAVFVDFCIL